MSHVPAHRVAHAFIRDEKAGKGLEKSTAYEGGIQEGNNRPEPTQKNARTSEQNRIWNASNDTIQAMIMRTT